MAKKKKTNFTTPILVGLLVIAAFLVGMFWTRIRYLEGGAPAAPKKEGQQLAQTSPAPSPPPVLESKERGEIETDGAVVKGDEKAPVTMVEFTDYQCPFCKRFFDETYEQILAEYGDQLFYVVRDFPLGFHQHAQKMAEVARCAGDQDKYWEMHDLLFAKQTEWSEKQEVADDISRFAQQLGLDEGKFDRCLKSGQYTQAVKDDSALGQKMGVTGTPTFFINGKKLVGAQPYENFKALIEAELAK